MRKSMYVCLAMFALAVAGCSSDDDKKEASPIVADNSALVIFSDPEMKALMLQFDKNKDGQISQEEASEVTYLDIPFEYAIKSLADLRNFVNLETLKCNNMTIGRQRSSVTLSGVQDLSKLTKLKYVEFTGWSYNDFSVKLPESVVSVNYHYSNGPSKNFDWSTKYANLEELNLELGNSDWEKEDWNFTGYKNLKYLYLGYFYAGTEPKFDLRDTKLLTDGSKFQFARTSGPWVPGNELLPVILKVTDAQKAYINSNNISFFGYEIQYE